MDGPVGMASDIRGIGVMALIVVVGATMRLTLAGVNPPNNSYDDHLTPVAMYAEEGSRPAPDACWQCYHPPVYHAVSAAVLTAAHGATGDARVAWEAVQVTTSALASVGTLIFALLLLRLYLPRDRLALTAGLISLAVLPRALYTAASMGTDALLVFFVTGAVYFLARLHQRRGDTLALGGLAAFAVLAAWTKQSGLVVLPLVVLAGWQIRGDGEDGRRSTWVAGAVGLVCLLALADEAWRYYETGIPLASNQHFEYRAAQQGQPPGRITLSTFASFLPFKLFAHPTLDASTVDSFWTQIFARTWFDYEPRFLPGNPTANWMARSLYGVGLVATGIVAMGAVRILKDGPVSARRLLVVPVGFLAAAVVQTLRFPHFSSMKALFVLPAAGVFALSFAYGVHEVRTRPWGRRLVIGLVAALAVVGVLHWGATVSMNAEALNTPTSPLWEFPALGPPGGP